MEKKKDGLTVEPAYHVVLAVNRNATGFRGINGRLPAKTRVGSIYSTIPPRFD